MKKSNFLGAMLIESPMMFSIIENIWDKHDIPTIPHGRDPLKQRVIETADTDKTVDWEAVRNEGCAAPRCSAEACVIVLRGL